MDSCGTAKALAAAVLLVVGGCVAPGELDAGRLAAYRQAMSHSSARAPRPGILRDSLLPAAGLPLPELAKDEVVERITETTRAYDPNLERQGDRLRDRIKTTVLVTDCALNPQTGEPEPKTAEQVRRVEVEATRTFRLVPRPGRPDRPPRQVLVGTVEKRTQFVRDPKTGTLLRSAEIVTTSTYDPNADDAGEGRLDEDEEPRVRVHTKVRTRTFRRHAPGGASTRPDHVRQTDRESRSTIPRWRLDAISGQPRAGKTTERARVGRKHGRPALLTGTRKLVHLPLEGVIAAALAANPDIRVVSLEPAISRQVMIEAAAAFDYTLFLDMSFLKEEGGNPARGLFDDARRIRSWSAGLRRVTPTGAAWSLRSSLSRNWDSSEFDGLYKYSTVLEVTQPLLRGAWPEVNLAALRIARLNARLSDVEFRAKVEEIVTAVTAAYWELVRARRTLRVQERLLRTTRETLRNVRARIGLDATRAQAKQVEASLKRRKADLIDTRRAIGDAQDRLLSLAPHPDLRALGAHEFAPVTPPPQGKAHLNPAEQLLAALRHSPQMEQARLAIAAAAVDVTVAENEALPVLDISAAVETQGFRRSLDWPHRTVQTGDPVIAYRMESTPQGARRVPVRADDCILGYRLNLLFEYPIGNRRAEAELRRRRLRHTQSIAAMQKTANDLALAIREQIRRVERTYAKVEAYRGAAEAAAAELQGLTDSERGLPRLEPAFLRTKLQAQRDVARAEENVEQALFEYNTARAELSRITGTVLELNRVKLALPVAPDLPQPRKPGPPVGPGSPAMP